MAPQETASYYGAVVMDREEKAVPATSPLAKRVAVAVLAAMAVVGAVAFLGSSSPTQEVAVVDVDEAQLPDCVCTNDCQYLPSSTVTWFSDTYEGRAEFVEKGVMFCTVDPNLKECADITAVRSAGGRSGMPRQYGASDYLAVCELFDSNCQNDENIFDGRGEGGCGIHGYCVPQPETAGIEALTNHRMHNCMCDPGYAQSGGTCVNVNECEMGISDCDVNNGAVCTDLSPEGVDPDNLIKPKYTCECRDEDGYEGTGYKATGGCKDIDRCLTADCGNVAMREVCVQEGPGGCVQTKLEKACDDAAAEDEPYGYHCHCKQGWDVNDPACLTDVNECELNMCPENSHCINTQGSFTCECKDNWVAMTVVENVPGEQSELVCEPEDFCAREPCLHGGTCVPGLAGCGRNENLNDAQMWLASLDDTSERDIKWDKYDYPNVETLDVCYTCNCVDGWDAIGNKNCEIDENECDETEEGGCPANSDCVNTAGSFECICHLGWYMDEEDFVCKDIDDCADVQPCAHGGTCVDCGTLCFTCNCVVGWRGTTCATDWNECLMGIHQCNDEATCKNNPGSYDCKCDPGYTGTGFSNANSALSEYVEDTDKTEDERAADAVSYTADLSRQPGCIDLNDCGYNTFETPCLNGADCVDVGANHYRCTCTTGWTDSECDEDVNECNPAEVIRNACSVFAKCINMNQLDQAANAPLKGYRCECLEGYTGDGQTCTDIDDCVRADGTRRCAAHGFCKDQGVDYYKCECDNGWIGQDCDDDENECMVGKDDCGRNANCINNDGSFECVCEYGYTGDPYTTGPSGCTDIDDCNADGNPCENGATCTDAGVDHYNCLCEVGWTDKTCDFDINECLSENPCHEKASCINTQGSFYCLCLSGYRGNGIDECNDIDDCAVDNGGCYGDAVCDSGITSGLVSGNARVCHCPIGWQGCGDPFCATDCIDCPAYKTDASTCTEVEGGTCTQVCNNGYWGAPGACAIDCKICSTCPVGYEVAQPCSPDENGDTVCANIDECATDTDKCQKPHSGCLDTEGSYLCQCEAGWWGNGLDLTQGTEDLPNGYQVNPGCTECTVCNPGFHETRPCTHSADRQCAIDLAPGDYMIESEADGNKQCVAIMQDEWYPARVNFGNGDEFCGIAVPEDKEGSELELVAARKELVWSFFNLYNNEDDKDSQLYTISHSNMDSDYQGAEKRCMYFGSFGSDIYPTLQSCVDYNNKGRCPWGSGVSSNGLCDFKPQVETTDETEIKLALIENGQAVFKVVAVKLVEKKFIIQANARDGDGWDCLAFEDSGAATNPSRYNWGNGAEWCGVGDWDGYGKEMSLLNNKQAVYILTQLP